MPTDGEADDTTDESADAAMNAREADVHARLTAAFAAARREVPLDDDAPTLVEITRQRRSNRHVDATGTPDAPTHEDGVTSRRNRTAQRRSRWITIGVPVAAVIIVIAVIGTILAVHKQRSRQLFASSSASCAMIIRFQGTSYRPIIRSAPTFTVGERLGIAHLPPCNDTGGTPDTSPGEPITVYRVEGLDPRDGLAYGWPENPTQVKLLAGALDLEKGFGTLTPGFQAFAAAHGAPMATTPPASSPPPPRSSIPGPESVTGDVPTTMADGAPGTPPPPPTPSTFDQRCPTTAEHTDPGQLPAPAEPLVDFTPTQVVVCRYLVSPTDPRHSSVIDDPATIQRLTGELSALRSPGNTMQCTAEKGPDLALIAVNGADKATIWVELYGCAIVTDGRNVFIGGKALAWLAGAP